MGYALRLWRTNCHAEAPDPDALSWRDLAVARSLDSARLRAESRVQRFLDAAMELQNEGSGKDFTVQEVVERSGQSLRSFYQYFSGKHELLLALFEESVRATADILRQEVDRESTPLERLHRFVLEYYRMCRPAEDGSTYAEGWTADHGRVRPAAAHDAPEGSGPGLRAAGRLVRRGAPGGRRGGGHP